MKGAIMPDATSRPSLSQVLEPVRYTWFVHATGNHDLWGCHTPEDALMQADDLLETLADEGPIDIYVGQITHEFRFVHGYPRMVPIEADQVLADRVLHCEAH